MKYLLLFTIKMYWWVIPPAKRNKCIYKKTCSHYVFDQTKNGGLILGLKSLNYRIKTCNPYFQLYKNPMTMETELILSNGDTLTKDEITERLIDKARNPLYAFSEKARKWSLTNTITRGFQITKIGQRIISVD